MVVVAAAAVVAAVEVVGWCCDGGGEGAPCWRRNSSMMSLSPSSVGEIIRNFNELLLSHQNDACSLGSIVFGNIHKAKGILVQDERKEIESFLSKPDITSRARERSAKFLAKGPG